MDADEAREGARTPGVWRGRLARGASGIAVLGAVAGVVALGQWPVQGNAAAQAVPPAEVAVPPSATTLVCAGPLILPDDTGRGDAEFDPTPVDPVTSVTAVTSVPAGGGDGVAAGTVTTLDGVPTGATLEAGGSGTSVSPAGAPLAVYAQPGTEPARVGAVSSGLVTAGDLRGLAAASCAQPVADAWLVGGATDLTSTAQLVLDNAGSTPAEVTLDLWGPSGRVDLSGERYLVAPGAERVVVLGGIAAEQRRVALHVSATGGRVGVHVQDSVLDGFTPAGTDLVVPGAAPSRRQVVPGVSVVASTVDDPHAPALRLLVPGDVGTTAHVTLLGPTGPAQLPGAESVDLAPGEVTDVPLGGLAAGSYTVLVSASEPVVASSVVSRPGSPGDLDDTPSTERAWAASVTPGQGGVAVLPSGARGTLVVGAVPDEDDDGTDGEATGTLRLLGADGEVLAERPVSVPAGTTGAWSLDSLLQGSGPVVPVTTGEPAGVEPPTAGGVRAVDLVTGSGVTVRLSWALVAEVDRPDGVLVSVLDPVPVRAGAPSVAVREDPRLGTR
ncbi:hypothetical protein Cch01nite_08850 [Cellulomonas chitinilytica]|uniref:Large extracellular alpha-helical protein n=2 Tax=Cellulomonas chitinilytica TaxID=398759 RepID=A0A919P1X2_9CELL|nr:hypothetical protein Cch01nite_08850 [Cellulomonas chitinilytica]